MDFSYQDALILDCIRSRRRGVTLADLLGWQDAVDRSYPAYDELNRALRRFMAIGFIVKAGDRFMPAASLLQWRSDTKTKTDTAYESFTQLAAQLNALAVTPAGDAITLPDRVVDEESFQRALQRCHRSADRLSIMLLVVGILLLGIAVKLVFTYPAIGLIVSGCLLLLTLLITLRRKR